MKFNYKMRYEEDQIKSSFLYETFFSGQLAIECLTPFYRREIKEYSEKIKGLTKEEIELIPNPFLEAKTFSEDMYDNVHLLELEESDPSGCTVEELVENGYNISVAQLKFGSELVELCSGVTLITGGSNVGKSTLIREIQAQLKCTVLPYGEPIITSISDSNQLGRLIGEFLFDESKVLIIDSITEFLFATGSEAATTGGLSTSLLVDINRLSNIIARQGKCLILVLNLLSQKDSIVVDALMGRVHGMINVPTRGRLEICSRITPAHRYTKCIDWNLANGDYTNVASIIIKSAKAVDAVSDRDGVFIGRKMEINIDKKGRWNGV